MVSRFRFQLFARTLSPHVEWRTSLLGGATIRKLQSFDNGEVKLQRHASSFGGPSMPIQVGPSNEPNDENDRIPNSSKENQTGKLKPTLFKMFESAATTFMSIMVLG